jgi:hypothetical protein
MGTGARFQLQGEEELGFPLNCHCTDWVRKGMSVLSRIRAQNKTGQNRVAYTEELVSGLYRRSQHKRTPFPTVPRQLPVPNFILFFVSFLPPASKVLHLGDKRRAKQAPNFWFCLIQYNLAIRILDIRIQ